MATTTAANVRSQSLLKSYVALTKPSIISLLVFTALGGMFLASEGLPDPMLAILVLGGGALAAGGANALNHYLDRDIDVLMSRTANRPIASGHIPPTHAMWFGIALNAVAFAILGWLVNPLSAVLTLSATLFYVFVYTKGLKRSTPQNIVIGGAAGAIPPVVGWTAVTGEIGIPALVMFIIVFCWTPPHFWALSLLIKDDYSRAGVPMLPVVVGVHETKKSIFKYSIALAVPTLLLFTHSPVGWVYLAGASVLSLGFIWYAWRLLRGQDIQGARATYLYSLAYLALLFGAIMVDSLVRV